MIKLSILLAAAGLACSSHASPIQIQAIRLGMTPQEFSSAYPKGVEPGFAIAGADTRLGFARPSVQFRDGRLAQFSAYFAEKDFDRIRSAIVAKNPSVQCTEKEGLAVCYDREGSFVLTRSGTATSLLLQSQRMAAEAERTLRALAPGEPLHAGM